MATKPDFHYLHLYIFKIVDGEAVSLFDQMVSYYPAYQVGMEITLLTGEESEVSGEETKLEVCKVSYTETIISVDKERKRPPQYTLYVELVNIEGDDNPVEESEDTSRKEFFAIDNLRTNSVLFNKFNSANLD